VAQYRELKKLLLLISFNVKIQNFGKIMQFNLLSYYFSNRMMWFNLTF